GNQNNVDSTGTEITVNYNYTVLSTDTLGTVAVGIAAAINSSNSGAGDPYVYATPDPAADLVILTARAPDLDGNAVTLAESVSPTTDTVGLTVSGANLTGGSDATLLAPYELVRIKGITGQILVPGLVNSVTPVNPAGAQLAPPIAPPPVQPLNQPLPQKLAGVEAYVDGILCPLVVVDGYYVVAQLPIELSEALEPDTTPPSPNSTINVTDTLRFPRTGSAVLRVANPDGTVLTSRARRCSTTRPWRPTPVWPITTRARPRRRSPWTAPSPAVIRRSSPSATGPTPTSFRKPTPRPPCATR